MAYRCDQAETGSPRDAIRCKVSGGPCAHQRMCMMEGRMVLTDGALRCPARDGQLPEEVKPAEVQKPVPAEEPKQEKKATGTAARKTASAAKKKTGTGAKK